MILFHGSKAIGHDSHIMHVTKQFFNNYAFNCFLKNQVRIDGPSNAIVKLQLAFPHTKILNDGTASNFIRITGRSV